METLFTPIKNFVDILGIDFMAYGMHVNIVCILVGGFMNKVFCCFADFIPTDFSTVHEQL